MRVRSTPLLESVTVVSVYVLFFFFSSRRRHTRCRRDWSSDVCSSDVGVHADLPAWSKAIANGDALAAVLGNDAFRDGARQVFVTGSFWFSAVPMAAAVATITALGEERAVEAMERAGAALGEGILAQARSWDLPVNYTGPAVMPYLSFTGDEGRQLADVFAAQALRGGAYL